MEGATTRKVYAMIILGVIIPGSKIDLILWCINCTALNLNDPVPHLYARDEYSSTISNYVVHHSCNEPKRSGE